MTPPHHPRPRNIFAPRRYITVLLFFPRRYHMFSNFWNWLKGLVGTAQEVLPVVKEGKDIVADLTKIISDIQGKQYSGVIGDVKQLGVDFAEFTAEVEKFINSVKK